MVEGEVAPPTVKCVTCRKDVDKDQAHTPNRKAASKGGDEYRCNRCNTLAMPVYRITGSDPQLKSFDSPWSAEGKISWLDKHRSETGKIFSKEIAKSLRDAVMVSTTSTEERHASHNFDTQYLWFTEDDLEKHPQYGKAGIIDNIKENAQKITCKVTRLEYYGVPKYESSSSEGMPVSSSSQVHVETSASRPSCSPPSPGRKLRSWDT